MKDSDSEQKSLPASDKKLRDGRKKGQVPSSRDLISGIALLGMIVYLLMTWKVLRGHVIELIDLVARAPTKTYDIAWREAIDATANVIWLALVPAVAVVVLTSVIAGMIGTLGPVFSFETIKPKFDHINPAQGLKRLFSMRNAVEFLKSGVKVLVLGSVLFVVLRVWLQSLFHAPNCGENCIVPLLFTALTPIVAVAALAFILIGILDTGLQRWLFLRDMRMTKTEHKRERKDIEGDPLILGERKRERTRQSTMPSRLGLSQANVIVTGDGCVAGLRYVPKEVAIPVVVLKSRADPDPIMHDKITEQNLPIIRDDELARVLVEDHKLGEFVRQEHFPKIAQILVQAKLV